MIEHLPRLCTIAMYYTCLFKGNPRYFFCLLTDVKDEASLMHYNISKSRLYILLHYFGQVVAPQDNHLSVSFTNKMLFRKYGYLFPFSSAKDEEMFQIFIAYFQDMKVNIHLTRQQLSFLLYSSLKE